MEAKKTEFFTDPRYVPEDPNQFRFPCGIAKACQSAGVDCGGMERQKRKGHRGFLLCHISLTFDKSEEVASETGCPKRDGVLHFGGSHKSRRKPRKSTAGFHVGLRTAAHFDKNITALGRGDLSCASGMLPCQDSTLACADTLRCPSSCLAISPLRCQIAV
jgi:hypothetical protein